MKQLFCILSLSLSSIFMFGQDVIKVIEGDTSKMVFERGEWFFKESLPDGHYMSYCGKDTAFIAKEVFIKNGKKNGVESRFFHRSKQKYAEICWLNGQKNGKEVHYNGNGTISYLLNFTNGELNGICIQNWTEGAKRYKGFYKNGFRDSIWTYYEHGNLRIDSTNYWVSKEYKYHNGKPLLMSAWNNKGIQIVTNGNGVITDSNYYSTTTEYLNGLENGKQETIRNNGTPENEKYYKDGLLTKQITYYDSNKVATVSEWTYPHSPETDTSMVWIDTWITDIFYNEVEYKCKAVKNGFWSAYYSNGNKSFEGEYRDDNQVGIWHWYFPNGNLKVVADFAKNEWLHFDSTGIEISDQKKEYLTLLTNNVWHLNQSLDTTIVTLSSFCNTMGQVSLLFHPTGLVDFSCWECPRNTSEFSISVDTLTLKLDDEEQDYHQVFRYQISSATQDKIIMKRIE